MKTRQDYLLKRQKLRSLLETEGVQWNNNSINRFTEMSGNMLHFLPDLSYEEHKTIFSEAQWHEWLNAWDLKLFAQDYPWQIRGWDAFLAQIMAQKGMICTFHFGGYQLVNYLLVRSKQPFALLVGDKVFREWGQRNTGLEIMLQEASENERFVLLNAKSRTSLREMHRLSQQGFQLLVYIDGLEGINYYNSETLETISFLGQEIELPRGAISLAHALKIPIYPLLAVREQDASIRINTLPTIEPVAHNNRVLFARKVLFKLYDWLESYVEHSPEQWTNWPHLSRIRSDVQRLDGEWCTLENGPYDDPMQYGLYYRSDGSCWLFRKKDLMTFSLQGLREDVLKCKWYGSVVS